MASAGSQPFHARRFRMKNSRAHADHAGSNKHSAVTRRQRERDKPNEADAHADHKRVGFGISIRVKPDDGLQDGADHLKGKSDESYLRKAQVERILEERIDRRQERLDGIIEQMAKAQREQDAHRRIAHGSGFNFWTQDLAFSFHYAFRF